MPRTAPHNNTPNPAVCRWKWKGKEGQLLWYDKAAKEEIEEQLPFVCLLLTRTASVTGYSRPRKSGMYSNDVQDTLAQPFVVRWQSKGLGTVAEGLWQDIKDKVKANGGKFAVNLYVAFRDPADKILKIGCVQASGCALGPWIEFENTFNDDLYTKAIVITPGSKDVSGDVEFVPPAFALKDTKKETDDEAGVLQKQVNEWLDAYFARPTTTRPDATPSSHDEPPPPAEESAPVAEAEDNVPF